MIGPGCDKKLASLTSSWPWVLDSAAKLSSKALILKPRNIITPVAKSLVARKHCWHAPTPISLKKKMIFWTDETDVAEMALRMNAQLCFDCLGQKEFKIIAFNGP